MYSDLKFDGWFSFVFNIIIPYSNILFLQIFLLLDLAKYQLREALTNSPHLLFNAIVVNVLRPSLQANLHEVTTTRKFVKIFHRSTEIKKSTQLKIPPKTISDPCQVLDAPQEIHYRKSLRPKIINRQERKVQVRILVYQFLNVQPKPYCILLHFLYLYFIMYRYIIQNILVHQQAFVLIIWMTTKGIC